MPVTRTNYLVLTGVLFLLGVLAMLAYRSNTSLAQIDVTDRHAQLVQVVQELEGDRGRLESRLHALRVEVAGLEKQSAARQGLYKSYTAELERLSMLAGLVAVEGPGLEVQLGDNPRPPENADDPNNYIIHDYDVRIVVNALWAGGAEAVAVNGQRVVQASAIRCVGTTILVNNTRLGSPFRIEALGEQSGLEEGLFRDVDARLLLEEHARNFGLAAKVTKRDDLELPAYTGGLSLAALRPAEFDEGSGGEEVSR